MTDETREKILDVALQLISAHGIHKIKAREVAQLSGVNLAALNYHFKSKEGLIKEALVQLSNKIVSLFKVLSDTSIVPEERLLTFIRVYGENLAQDPGVIRSIFTQIILEEKIIPEVVTTITKGTEALKKVISEVTCIKDEQVLNVKVVHLMSSMVYPALFGKYLKVIFGIDYAKEIERIKYLDVISEDLFNSKKGR